MRSNQRIIYAERIERALAAIERAVAAGTVPSLADLASAAALSEYHFHRIYRAMTGETVGDTLARVRLGGSLPSLARAEGIAGATERSLYATSQAYARALKARSGATASALRDDAALREIVAESLREPAASGDEPLRIAIVSFEPVRLLAVRNVGAYAELNAGYSRLFERILAQLAPEDIAGLYGLPHDDPRAVAEDACRFDCAVDTGGKGEAAGELQAIDLPGGISLRLHHAGDYDLIHTAIDELYAAAITLGLPLADSDPVIFYHFDPEDVPTEDLRADVHLMLE